MTIRVVIAEDHPMFREGLKAMLFMIPGIDVVAAVETGTEAVEAAEQHAADVVVMDLEMPHGTGLEATARLAVAYPKARVLVLTSHDDDSSVYSALRAGAHGFLLKSATPAEIARAVLAVGDGDAVFDEAVMTRITRHFATGGRSSNRSTFPDLTEREVEVLELMAQGRSNPYIADHFVVSIKTIRNHVSNIFTKLGVSTRAEAIVLARERGFPGGGDG